MRTLAFIAIVLLIVSFIEAKKVPKKCKGLDGNKYKIGKGYEVNCQQFTCRPTKPSRRGPKMAKQNCCKHQGSEKHGKCSPGHSPVKDNSTEETKIPICMTVDGDIAGVSCVFPFIYNDTFYMGCTLDGAEDRRPWCSTQVDKNSFHVKGDDHWGHCDSECPTHSGNGLSVGEKRQANVNELQAIVESGKTLTEIIKDLKGMLSDSLSSYIGDLDEEVRKIDTTFDGLKAEERRYIEDAHLLLTTSETKLFGLRQTLTLLAKETIERSNRIIKVFKMLEDDPDKASKLIKYSQKKMNQLFIRSKGILKQSLDEYKDILKNVAATKNKLESFIRHVDGLGDDDNERFKEWIKDIRAKVYAGTASACLIFPPACVAFIPAATILEKKIKEGKESIQRMINAARSAEINAENLKKKVDEKHKYVLREIDLVNKWSSQVAQNSEEYASSEDILEFIEIFGQKDAISMLCDLTKASKDYIDHKFPGLEEYEITAPALDSACSGSETTTVAKYSVPVRGCLWGYNDKTYYGVSLEQCKEKCTTASFACQSLEYEEKSKKCWLSSDSKETQPNSYRKPCTGIYSHLLYLETTGECVCKTISGNEVGVACKFPFQHYATGITYNGCTNARTDGSDLYWCSTKTNSEGVHEQGNWGNCNDFCPRA